MTHSVKASEPSMEEILASIRRIIAEDDTIRSAQSGPEASRIAAGFAKPTASSPPPAPLPTAARSIEPSPAAVARDLFEEQSADTLAPGVATPSSASPSAASRVAAIAQCGTTDGISDAGFQGKPDSAQLLSRETSAAVNAAFNTLAQSVLVRNARAVEDLMREMLRPMLKKWLDENLPSLVEQLVRAEIERVSRGH